MSSFAERRPVDLTRQLSLASGSHHSCRLCGGGCRSYDVLLTEREARRLDLDLWRPLLHDVPDETPLVLLDEATHQYTLNKVDGRCVFLDSDNLCIVHKSSGPDAKPIACQFFPFQVVQSPDGLHASLNVGCRRLVEMTDTDDAPDLVDAERLLAQVQAVATIGGSVPLTPEMEITYAEFQDWQSRLLAILAVPESDWPAVWERLRAAAGLLLTIPGASANSDGSGLFRALHRLISQPQPDTLRPSLSVLYQRIEPMLARLIASPNPHLTLDAPAQFYAVIARQSLEGQQAALHRTARTGWVALLAALVGGLHGAAYRVEQSGQQADHALNEALSDLTDLLLSPAGQIALTEPNQQAFLLALRDQPSG